MTTTRDTSCTTNSQTGQGASTPAPTPHTRTPFQDFHEMQEKIGLIEVATPLNSILQIRSDLGYMMEQCKQLKAKMDEHLTEWIQANGEIRWGKDNTKRIFLATDKTTKCRALRPALEALLNKCDGDWEVFANTLSSNAIKYGAAREVMGPELWEQHFEVIEKTVIEEGETKPVKKLIEVDEQFIKPKGASK